MAYFSENKYEFAYPIIFSIIWKLKKMVFLVQFLIPKWHYDIFIMKITSLDFLRRLVYLCMVCHWVYKCIPTSTLFIQVHPVVWPSSKVVWSLSKIRVRQKFLTHIFFKYEENVIWFWRKKYQLNVYIVQFCLTTARNHRSVDGHQSHQLSGTRSHMWVWMYCSHQLRDGCG